MQDFSNFSRTFHRKIRQNKSKLLHKNRKCSRIKIDYKRNKGENYNNEKNLNKQKVANEQANDNELRQLAMVEATTHLENEDYIEINEPFSV